MLMLCYHCKMTSVGEAGVFHQLILEASAEENFFFLSYKLNLQSWLCSN